MPVSSGNEGFPALSIDLQSESVIDLLQTTPNDDSVFDFSDDVPLFSSSNVLESINLPIAKVDPKDVVKEDALIGSCFQSTLGSTNVDVSQYTTSPTLSNTPVDEVFLAPLPISSSTTKHVPAKPIRQTIPQPVKPFQRPNPRATNQFVINPFIISQKKSLTHPNSLHRTCKNRNTCAKAINLTKTMKAGSLSTRTSTTNSSRCVMNRAQGITTAQTEDVAKLSSRSGSVMSSTRLKDTLDDVTKSSLVDNGTSLPSMHTRDVSESLCSTTKAQSLSDSTSLKNAKSHSALTSSVATYHKLSGPRIIVPPPKPRTVPSTEIPAKLCTTLILPMSLSSSTGAINIASTSSTSQTAKTSSTSHSSSKPRFNVMMRASQNITAVTTVQTCPNSSVNVTTGSHKPFVMVPAPSNCGNPSGAILYTATTTPCTKTNRLLAVPVTTASQPVTAESVMGTNTALTFSSEVMQSTHHIPATQSVPPKTHTMPLTVPDSTIKPRNKLFIPIASTATGISYLVTSTISSLSKISQTATTTAAVCTHITTIRSDSSNKTRTRFILPVAQNISSTLSGLTSTTDSNSTRNNTLAIISPHISSPLDSSASSIGTIRAFAIAKPQAAAAKSHSASAVTTNQSGSSNSNDLPAITALLTSGLTSPSTTVSETVNRSLSRIFMPFIRGSSNSRNFVVGPGTSNVTTRNLTPSTYILTSAMGTLPVNASSEASKPQQRVVIPLINSTSAPVAPNATTLHRTIASDYASLAMEGSSKLRNRLLVPTAPLNVNSYGINTGVAAPTACTITRGRQTFSTVSTLSGLSRSSETFNPLTSPTTHNMFAANAAHISFATTTVSSIPSRKSQSPVALSVPAGATSSTPLCSFTSATPALTSTGHRYIIKLATTHNASPDIVSTVTASTPITTATLSPSEQCIESRSARLRTLPNPRTYSVAQRNVCRSERTTNSRATVKRIVMPPAPLQIFADVVCPPTTTNQTAAGPSQHSSQFTLSKASGSSTLVVPQYKNTVFKNLSTIAHPVPCTRIPTTTTTTTTERVYLRRPVTCVAPRRTFPTTTSHASHSPSQRARYTYSGTTPSTSYGIHGSATSSTVPRPINTPPYDTKSGRCDDNDLK